MKNLPRKKILKAQFHLQDPDPDPAWRFESGSTRIRFRNTGRNKGCDRVPHGSTLFCNTVGIKLESCIREK